MLINLTPHQLNIECGNGETISIEPSGQIARVDVEYQPHLDISAGDVSIPTALSVTGAVQDLPDPQDGVIYITALVVAQLVRRADVLSPGPLQRDEQGRVTGCKGLTRHVIT